MCECISAEADTGPFKAAGAVVHVRKEWLSFFQRRAAERSWRELNKGEKKRNEEKKEERNARRCRVVRCTSVC